MQLRINCSYCRTPILTHSQAPSVRCNRCGALSRVSDPLHPQHFMKGAPTVVRKKAVICGVSYKDTEEELHGCANDAKNMKHLLVNRLKFPECNIVMLTEEERDRNKLPTKQNIMRAMAWLVQGCHAGDSLVFYYSGHGTQLKSGNGDELDGFDEAIMPLDYETNGMIVDDVLNETLVRPLLPGVKLHAILDCCRSGTSMDLPYLCKLESNGKHLWEDHRPPSGKYKGTRGGEAICISGCDDHQLSYEKKDLTKVTHTGAMTYWFIKAIEQGLARTYGSLFKAMKAGIDNMENENEDENETQEPQLTANKPFDINAKLFSM